MKIRLWLRQGRNEVRWCPGQEASLAPPCSKQVFRKQTYCTEESTWDIAGTFRRLPQWFGAPIVTRCPGNCAPLATPRYAPGLRGMKCTKENFDYGHVVVTTKRGRDYWYIHEMFKLPEVVLPINKYKAHYEENKLVCFLNARYN